MKHYTHTVILSRYNPENIKEYIGCRKYEVTYVPTNNWSWYLILVNNIYTGVVISVTKAVQGGPIRSKILRAVENYKLKINIPYQNRTNRHFPSVDAAVQTDKLFKNTISKIKSFNRRDELSNYPELITKITS